METESGAFLGKCADVQFSTKDYKVEWLFPRKWFRWSHPVRATQIVEVTDDAVIIKDAGATVKVKDEQPEVPVIPQVEAA